MHNLQAGKFRSDMRIRQRSASELLQRAEHMAIPISEKCVAKMLISRYATKAFIKCFKQPGFLFWINNYTKRKYSKSESIDIIPTKRKYSKSESIDIIPIKTFTVIV